MSNITTLHLGLINILESLLNVWKWCLFLTSFSIVHWLQSVMVWKIARFASIKQICQTCKLIKFIFSFTPYFVFLTTLKGPFTMNICIRTCDCFLRYLPPQHHRNQWYPSWFPHFRTDKFPWLFQYFISFPVFYLMNLTNTKSYLTNTFQF